MPGAIVVIDRPRLPTCYETVWILFARRPAQFGRVRVELSDLVEYDISSGHA